MTTDKNLSQFIINKLTKAQFETIEEPSSDEFYMITDEDIVPSTDNVTINTTAQNKLQAIGVLDGSTNTADKFVTLTKAEYDALETKDANTFYNITDDNVTTITVGFSNLTGQPTDNTNLATALNAKQATLVSGTNIKTINNQTLLGSGDITISGGSSSEVLETITAMSTSAVVVTSSSAIYSKTISEDTTFTFDVSGLGTLTNKAVTFELYLDMSSTVYTLTFPNTVTWIEQPDFTTAGKYLLVFRSMDGGSSYLGNLECQW